MMVSNIVVIYQDIPTLENVSNKVNYPSILIILALG
jgi:hypothetical protein